MKLPRKVSRQTPTLDMHLHVWGITTDALAKKMDTHPRNVERWREAESCPQKTKFLKLAAALEISHENLLNILRASSDAMKETQEQLAVRWYGAVLSRLESVADVSDNMRDDLHELAQRTIRLGKKRLKPFGSKPSAAQSSDAATVEVQRPKFKLRKRKVRHDAA